MVNRTSANTRPSTFRGEILICTEMPLKCEHERCNSASNCQTPPPNLMWCYVCAWNYKYIYIYILINQTELYTQVHEYTCKYMNIHANTHVYRSRPTFKQAEFCIGESPKCISSFHSTSYKQHETIALLMPSPKPSPNGSGRQRCGNGDIIFPPHDYTDINT